MQVLAQRLFVGARDAIVEEAVGGRVGEAAVLDGLHGVGDRKVCFGGIGGRWKGGDYVVMEGSLSLRKGIFL